MRSSYRRWCIGVYRSDSGCLRVAYVTKDGTPVASVAAMVGDRPILLWRVYHGPEMKYSAARLRLLEEAREAGIEGAIEMIDVKGPIVHRLSRAPRVPKVLNVVVSNWCKHLWLRAQAAGLTRQSGQRKQKKKKKAEAEATFLDIGTAGMRFTDDIIRLAGLIALVGDVTDPDAARVSSALCLLFFSPKRTPHWRVAIQLLRPERELLLRIADNVQAFGKYCDADQLAKGKYKLDQVINCMLEVSQPDVYVQYGAGAGFVEPRTLYHPNVLKVAREQLRGAFGPLAEMSTRHAEQIRRTVRVVRC